MNEWTNLDELKKRRFESLISSKKAIRDHPAEYRELKKLVQSILLDKVDVSEYYPMADRLCYLLQALIQTGSGSVFYYFYQNIDPKQSGEVRFFRAICSDLYEQLHIVDQFRTEEGHIRRIK